MAGPGAPGQRAVRLAGPPSCLGWCALVFPCSTPPRAACFPPHPRQVIDDLDEIHFTMKKARKVLRDMARSLMTDK